MRYFWIYKVVGKRESSCLSYQSWSAALRRETKIQTFITSHLLQNVQNCWTVLYSEICKIYVLFPELPTMLRLSLQHLQRKRFWLRPIQSSCSVVVSLSSSPCRFKVINHDPTQQNQKLELVKDDLLTRLYKKIFTGVPVSKLRASGYILSTHCSQRIDIVNFFETFDMPDTFYSWFLVTEIHVWLIGVSCLSPSSGGRAARPAVLQASPRCSAVSPF